MKLYDCKVRLQGEVKDEVRKYGVTAAEIKVLRRIHGDDAVLEIADNGAADRNEHEERERLEAVYGDKIISKIFGISVQKIEEDVIEDFSDELSESDPKPAAAAPVRRTRVSRPAAEDAVALAAQATAQSSVLD